MTHAKTKGTWHVEPHDDGSWWVVGPDPQDGRKVCVAAFEMEQDAHHVCQLHNQYERQTVMLDSRSRSYEQNVQP